MSKPRRRAISAGGVIGHRNEKFKRDKLHLSLRTKQIATVGSTLRERSTYQHQQVSPGTAG